MNKISDDKQYNIFHPYCYNANTIEMKKLINEEKKIFKKIGKNNNSIENGNSNDILYNDSIKKTTNGNYNYEKNIELSSSEKKSLINAIREMLIDESNLTLEINTEDYSIKQNNNIILTYEDIQYPEKFSWCFLKENQYYLNGISNYETFKIFRSLIPNKIDFAKNILKEKISTPEKIKKHKNKIKQKNKKIEEKEKYCICNKNDKLNWVGCDNGNGKCPGKGWYHMECIPELKNYTIDNFNNQFEKYYCPSCRSNFNLKNIDKNGNEINSPLSMEEKSININIHNENSNMDLELKKKESNSIECVNIHNTEEKGDLEENHNNKDKIETLMEIEGNINLQDNQKESEKTN